METWKTTLHSIYPPSQSVLFTPYFPGGGCWRSVEETPVRDLGDSLQCLRLLVRTTNISHLFLPLSQPLSIRSICVCMAALQYVAYTCALKRLGAHLHDFELPEMVLVSGIIETPNKVL